MTVRPWNALRPSASVTMLTEWSRNPNNQRQPGASPLSGEGIRSNFANVSFKYFVSAHARVALYPKGDSLGRQIAHDPEKRQATACISAKVDIQAVASV
jgi:hypothetical protein